VFLGALPPSVKKGPRARLEAADLRVRRDFAFRCSPPCRPALSSRRHWRSTRSWIAGVSVFDLIEGESLARGKKSLASKSPCNTVLRLSKHAWSSRPALRQAQGEVVVALALRRHRELGLSLAGISRLQAVAALRCAS
jgi:hypothetical protein